MNKKEIRRFKVYSALLFVLVSVAAIIYAKLGGFDDIIVEEANKSSFQIAGLHIDRQFNSKEIKETFEKLRAEAEKGNLLGCQLSIVSYSQSERDRQFMGLVLIEGIAEVSEEYEILELSYADAFKVDLKMHNMVMPTKEDVEDRIRAYANANEMTADSVFLEIYNHDNTVTIYGFRSDTVKIASES